MLLTLGILNLILLIANAIFIIKIQEMYDDESRKIDKYADDELSEFKNKIKSEDWRQFGRAKR